MDNGPSTATITKVSHSTGGRATDTFNPALILNSNLAITNNLAGSSWGFNLNGAISETGGSRSVTFSAAINPTWITLTNTNSSYSGRTSVVLGTLNFFSIGNVGSGNSALGAPTNATNGTIALGSGANTVWFVYSGTAANAATDRVLDFAGTNQLVHLQSTGGRQITYTSPFTFSGSGTKTLNIGTSVNISGTVVVSSNIVYGNLSVQASLGGVQLLGLNTFTGATSLYRTTLTINSIADWNTGIASSLGAPMTLTGATISFNSLTSSEASAPVLVYTGTGHSSNRPIAMTDSQASVASGAVIDASGSGKLTLTGGVNNAANGAKTVVFQGAGQGELAGVISDGTSAGRTTSVAKSGDGTWTLSGANTFSGTTNINRGVLTFGSRAALYGGTAANWTQALIRTSGTAAATLGLGVGGTAGFTNGDITTLIGNLGTGAVSTGGMRATSSWGFDTTNTGSTFTVADTIANTTTGGGAIGVVKLGSGTLALSGTNTYTHGTRIDGGVLTITNTAALGSGTGFLSFTGGTLDLATLTLTRDGAVTATAGRLTNGVLTGSAGLTKTGSGTFRIDSTANTFMGSTAIQEGVVEVPSVAAAGVPSSLGSGTGANATVNLGSLATSGTFRYIGTTGATTNRTFNLSGTTGGGAIEASGAGALVITSPMTAAAGSKTLTLGGTSTQLNSIGTITGTGVAVVKDGPGLWLLSGSNDYRGGFTLKAGTVVATLEGGGDGVFGASSGPAPVIGDTAADAAVTARLLLAAGVRSSRTLTVPATGGSQAVVLGSYATSGTSAEFYNSQIRLGRPVTLMAPAGGTTVFNTTLRDFAGTATPTVDVSFGTADGTGTVLVTTGTLATGGMVNVRHGTLNVDGFGTLSASGVGIDSGATLAGSGLVTATLGGAGLVAPGNSPGILTAQAVNPTGGLDWAFEFSGTAAPDYGNAENSLNDILRLTGATPLTAGLDANNVVSLYLPASAAAGAVYPGGFFIDSGASFATFKSLVSGGAIVAYYQSGSGAFSYNGQQYALLSDKGFQVDWGVTTVPTASFAGSPVSGGQMTTFSVVVPEPGALALAALGLGLAGYGVRRRRAA